MTIRTQDLIHSSDSIIAKKETNDCTVYAFAAAFDLDYDTAHKEVAARFGRVDKRGAKMFKVLEGLQVGDWVNNRVITQVISWPKSNYKCYGEIVPRAVRLSSFTVKYAKGTYLILVRGHALTVRDGIVIDSTRPRPSSIVQYAFKVEVGETK